MRIALISDIHGNLVALEAVLAELDREALDQIVCLGDVVEGGPQPHAVLERLQQVGCPIVMGNTDLRMSTARSDEPRTPDLPPGYTLELWVIDQLMPTERAFLGALPPTVTVALPDAMPLLAFHGSPRSNTDAIVAATPDEKLDAWFAGIHASVLVGGHTHTPLVRRYHDMVLINPGSVGLPFVRSAPHHPVRRPHWAEYALLNVTDGHLSIDLRRTSIDINALQRSVIDSGMPYPDLWMQDWWR